MLAAVISIYGSVMNAACLLQAWNCWRIRGSAGLSGTQVVMTLFGMLLWVLYGAQQASPALYVPSLIGLVSWLVVGAVALRFREAREHASEWATGWTSEWATVAPEPVSEPAFAAESGCVVTPEAAYS